ncbi:MULTISPECIES: hypothetical protein [unclassified Micromonospora]|uniref:hypothetical protein n=1 Tax=unclassified Micromonospora TaxID=2617518 RepID=UPI002FEEC985
MATRNASGRASGSAATKNVPGNQTPNTPDINESEIARLKVDQLRDRLRRRGITGTADMRKDELVDALITALREGRKTTRSGTGRTSGSNSGSRGGGTGEQPGNQTPNTPDVNESEIARLKVDQLRDRLRRRGITGTADMRKDELVDALITALREGRKTTRSGTGRTSRSNSGRSDSSSSNNGRSNSGSSKPGRSNSGGSGSGGKSATAERSRRPRPGAPELAAPEVELAEVERRAAELADVTPLATEVEEVERRAAELEEAVSESTTPEATRPGARVPQPRSGRDDAAGDVTDRQPVRTPDERTGSTLTLETADRVLTSMVPAEMEPVDEVVTPEGTVLTAGNGAADAAVDTPPLPGTDARDPASSPAR